MKRRTFFSSAFASALIWPNRVAAEINDPLRTFRIGDGPARKNQKDFAEAVKLVLRRTGLKWCLDVQDGLVPSGPPERVAEELGERFGAILNVFTFGNLCLEYSFDWQEEHDTFGVYTTIKWKDPRTRGGEHETVTLGDGPNPLCHPNIFLHPLQFLKAAEEGFANGAIFYSQGAFTVGQGSMSVGDLYA